jgi:hypothetical protein
LQSPRLLGAFTKDQQATLGPRHSFDKWSNIGAMDEQDILSIEFLH